MNFDHKRVIVRADLDIKIDSEGNIEFDGRLVEALPTIKYVLEHNCKQIIIMGHLGRPDGKIVDKLKMDRVCERLEKLLGMLIVKLDDCVDVKIPDAKIILLENLRFHKEEEENDDVFARKLSKLGDMYVNDAFASCHRAHASIVGIPKYIPGCIGFLVEKELKYLQLTNPERPFIGILGGAKISTKFAVIKEMLKKVDYILLGGAMIFTLYKAKGYEIGKSFHEDEFLSEAKMLLNNEKIILPDDVVVSSSMDSAESFIVHEHKIPPDMMGLDIGPESVQLFKDYLKKAKTVFWNGPLGYFENPVFAHGTRAIAEYLASSDKTVIIGGGDTEDAIKDWKGQFTHVSTGGGASLEMVSGKELPAIKALKENEIEFHDVLL
jgi:3-phosphoglycerate kinase